MKLSGQLHAPAALSQGERALTVSLEQECSVGPGAGLDAVVKKKDSIFAPAGNRSPVVQPVA